MEESEKRRERLRAMRMEAAQGDVNNDSENFTESHGLSNPLIETSATHQESCAPQRFDYYTDPMAAFSGNRRRSNVSHQISQECFTPPRLQNTVMTPSPALQSQINYSVDQGMHQPQELPWSPIGMGRPFGAQPGTPRGALNGSGGTSVYYFPSNSPSGGSFPSPASPGFGQGGRPSFSSGQVGGRWISNSPGPYSEHGGIPGFGQQGGPGFNSRQGRGYWLNNSPSPGSGRGGLGQESGPGFNPEQGRESWSNNSPSPGPGCGGSPGFGQGGRPSFNSGQGRGNWFKNSPIPDSGSGDSPGPSSGTGKGRWLGNITSPGLGWSGGRGRGCHDSVSAELRPDLYYNRSMVEDPWKFLKPVIWKREDSPVKRPDYRKSWLPNSISMKRAKATEASSESKTQPSLAEYLAASFNEAVKNEAINDEPSVL